MESGLFRVLDRTLSYGCIGAGVERWALSDAVPTSDCAIAVK